PSSPFPAAGPSPRGPEAPLARTAPTARPPPRPIPARRHRPPARPPEEPPVPIVLLDPEPALVHQRVMPRAQQDQILEARLPAARPMHHVMRFDETRSPTPREAAAAIPRP